jgi:hypothetical protein
MEAAASVTRVSQVIQNSPAIPLWTGLDGNGPWWPEIASEAACSGSKRGHPGDGCGPGKRVGSVSGAEGRRFESGRGHHLTSHFAESLGLPPVSVGALLPASRTSWAPPLSSVGDAGRRIAFRGRGSSPAPLDGSDEFVDAGTEVPTDDCEGVKRGQVLDRFG